MDKYDRGMICLILLVFAVVGSLIGLIGIGNTEVTGMVTATFYGSWPWEHTEVIFVQYAPSGVILDETFERTFAGNLELELGQVYRISSHKNFLQLWRRPTLLWRLPTKIEIVG